MPTRQTYEQYVSDSLKTCLLLLRDLEARRKAGILTIEQQQMLANLTQEKLMWQELLEAPRERDSA